MTTPTDLPAQQRLPCGHPAELMLASAETGEPLYCELCDAQSGRRDAETMEAELRAALATQAAEIALAYDVERQLSEQNASLDAEVARLERVEELAIEIETKLRAEARAASAEIARLRADACARDKLAAFGAWCAREFRDSLLGVDGGSAQDAMERLGVIVKTEVTEPSGEGCVCAEYGAFPHNCYKFPAEISAAMKDKPHG